MQHRVAPSFVTVVACTLLPYAAWASDLSSTVDVKIAPQPLASALLEFSAQTQIQIVTSGADVRELKTNGLSGHMTVRAALEQLLEGSGLSFKMMGDSTVGLVRATADVHREDQTFENKTVELREVIVTAQKKSERLQDVPVPLTVVDTDALARSGQDRLQDYFATVPGMSLLSTPNGGGTQYVTLRGLSTSSGTGPTVAMVIDDVPFGASTETTLGQFGYPDIDPGDLSHIEVLKGPQGTLYGADSLGGIIKVVTQDPSTERFSGRVQMLGEDILDGGAGYGVRGSANIPLSDTFAMRVSVFSRRDPGYIDDVSTGQDNVNSANVYGARLGALWRASEAFSAKLSALFQNTQGFGTSEINSNSQFQPTALGDLRQTGLPGTGGYNAQIQLYTATLTAKFAGMNFVSVSGFGINKWSNTLDFSGVSAYYGQPTFNTPADAYYNTTETRKFSQEFRLSASAGSYLDWLAGAFYTHEKGPLFQSINANDPVTGAYLGTAYSGYFAGTFYEWAAFTDFTVHVTDHFDVQVGGRGSWNHQTFSLTYGGKENEPVVARPANHANGTSFTYLFSPEYKFSPDLMVYARIASGYRVGSPNFSYGLPGVPQSYKPDTTTNYDLGIKAQLFDHALTVDASAYHIDWKDIQLGVSGAQCNCYYLVNGTKAKSDGLELSLDVHPAPGTTVGLNGSYNNAVLTENLPPEAVNVGTYGLAGDRLPYSARTSGSLSINQDIVHFSNGTGLLGADVTYISARDSVFASSATSVRQQFPAYTTVNLHAGVHVQDWLFNLFANNVGDRRGITGGASSFAINNPGGYYATIIQPRTVGLSITKIF